MNKHVGNIFYVSMLLMICSAQAVETKWSLETQNKTKLKNFVIAFYPKVKVSTTSAASVELIQQGKSFVPSHLAIGVGSTVLFPNKDDTAHSIYSFSATKKFNIDLYKKSDKIPEVKFDEEGVIVLGCNIHDWMMGTIIVVDTPYFIFSSDEVAVINLPADEYAVKVWQREINMEKIVDLKKQIVVSELPDQKFNLNVTIKAGDNW